jgi:signal transduction histidine kinase
MRNMVLASNASRFFAKQTDIAGLMETISGSARILFGFTEALLLLTDKSGQALGGKPGSGQAERLAEFSIPLAAGGLVADAALMRKIAILRRDGELLTLPEEQLLGLLRADCLICLPMTVSGRCIGMLVGSIGDYQALELQRRERFLLAYASQAANALQAASSNQAEIDNRVASVTDQYQAASRRVAHEVNNPLAIIKNYLGILDSRLRKQDIVVGEVAILNEEIDRVGQIVHALTDLEPVASGAAAEVGRVVRDVVRLFRDTEYVPASVTIRTDLQEDETVLEGSAQAGADEFAEERCRSADHWWRNRDRRLWAGQPRRPAVRGTPCQRQRRRHTARYPAPAVLAGRKHQGWTRTRPGSKHCP